jgi:hypothetical protein
MAEVEKVEKTEIVLRLSEEEAKSLLAVTTRVGGSHETSRRKHIQSIHDGVVAAMGILLGADPPDRWYDEAAGYRNAIYFAEGTL